MANLAEAMWTHGHSMQVEYPENIHRVWRAGFFAEIEGKPNTNNWFHFAIPTTVIVDDRRLRVGSVMILCETLSQSAIVRDVHVFDGPSRIAEHNGVNLTGGIGFARFDVPAHPHVSLGIGISVGVSFADASAPLTMRFISAGCDFIL